MASAFNSGVKSIKSSSQFLALNKVQAKLRGLSWRQYLTWNKGKQEPVARRWPNWFAGNAIKGVQPTLLRCLNYCRNIATIDINIQCDWCLWCIEVPNLMMHKLEVPCPFPVLAFSAIILAAKRLSPGLKPP
ncbi:MAG: hypothetical protein Ct9H300mP22_6880 [Gammaproteobacteria bacterium]|nr:MAG: hypothetical protein Ct9H300mP22_6880 [Gammaproteobacteria bacterium]